MDMAQVMVAVPAVMGLVLVAHLLGRVLLSPVLPAVGSVPLRHLLGLVTGIGTIGAATLLAGITIGYSAEVIAAVYLSMSLAAVGYHLLWLRKVRGTLKWPNWQLDGAEKILAIVLGVHFLLYLATGFAYSYGSDSFSYVFLAQEHLRVGKLVPMTLEPFLEVHPLFKAPCMFEMVYLNLLAMANLIALSLIAKLQFIVATLMIFFISREMGGPKAGWLAIALLLTEPVIAYFAGESADNYFIALAFQIASIYFLWLYHRAPRPALLIVAGVLAGMMTASKLTTVYFLALTLALSPLLVQISHKAAGADSDWRKIVGHSLAFCLPAAILAGLFPIVLYLISGETIMGLNWIVGAPGHAPSNTWIKPYFDLEYHPLLRYRNVFEASPDIPLPIAQLKELFSYYLRNPLRLTTYPDWIYSHTPLALALGLALPVAVALIRNKHCDSYMRWLAIVLLVSYVIKLFTFPLIIPPKSEIFQIVPAAMMAAICLARSSVGGWTATTKSSRFSRLVRVTQSPVQLSLLALLPFVVLNLCYVIKQYGWVIATYSFKSQTEVATMFHQEWPADNLTEKDILFGRITNQVCYIRKPEIRQFFWEAMLFVPWQRIEERIIATNANYLFDSSQPPDKLLSGYQAILPIIRRRDSATYVRLQDAAELYKTNYYAKEAFLNKHFEEVYQDATGVMYHKRGSQ